MSFLDEIIDIEQEGQVIEARALRARDWIPVAAAMATHQAMDDAYEPGGVIINPRLDAPLDQAGIANPTVALNQYKSLERILADTQTTDLRQRETADDVLSSKIKADGKLIIKILRGGQRIGSLSQIARQQLITEGPQAIYFDKFSTSSVTVPDEERVQITETFGGNFIYGFGRRPQYLRISGQVLNGSMDVIINGQRRSHDWANALIRKYDTYFRLTSLIRNSMRVVIFCQDVIYTGFLLNLMPTVTAESQNVMQVSLSMILADRRFSRDEDDTIPGTLLKSGLYLPGKNTPDAYFTQARLESYFEKGYLSVVELDLSEKRKELNEVLAQMLAQAGEAGATLVNAEEALVPIPPQEPYSWSDVLEYQVHKAYRGAAFTVQRDLAALSRLKARADEAESQWITTYNRGGSFSIGGAAASSVLARTAYQAASAVRSSFSGQQRTLLERQAALNRLADRALGLYQSLDAAGAPVATASTPVTLDGFTPPDVA